MRKLATASIERLIKIATTYIAIVALSTISSFAISSGRSVVQTVKPSGDITGVEDVINIQKAIDKYDVITLQPGLYYIGKTINIDRSNISVVGLAHPQNTKLKQVGISTTIIKTPNGAKNISIEKISFESEEGVDGYNKPFIANSTAIELYKSANTTVQNCDFTGFRSAALNIYNYLGVKREQNNSITNNRFDRCWMGVAMWHSSEYSILSGNRFTLCRTAIYNESGNWEIIGNNICDCRAIIVVTNRPGQVNIKPGGNFAHGSIVGNTMNHSGDAWPNSPKLTIDGIDFDPKGVWIYGDIISHSFVGNICWYTPFTFSGGITDDIYISGGLINNSTITSDGATIHISGVDSQRSTTYHKINGGIINIK